MILGTVKRKWSTKFFKENCPPGKLLSDELGEIEATGQTIFQVIRESLGSYTIIYYLDSVSPTPETVENQQ